LIPIHNVMQLVMKKDRKFGRENRRGYQVTNF